MAEGSSSWKKWASIGLILAIAAVVLVFGIVNYMANSSEDEETIRFGATISLTGRYAREGRATQQGYDLWATQWDVDIGSSTNDYDYDDLSNLYEYGLGGNPTNGLDRGTLPVFSKSGSAFLYVHPKRSDDTNITYTVETTTNLVSGVWTNQGYTITGTNITGGLFNFVTNEIDTVRNINFIRLRIEQ